MEKMLFYKVYYFKDSRKHKTYYFQDKMNCLQARFLAYKEYDYERLTTRNFDVPVTNVESKWVSEEDIDQIVFCDDNKTDNNQDIER